MRIAYLICSIFSLFFSQIFADISPDVLERIKKYTAKCTEGTGTLYYAVRNNDEEVAMVLLEGGVNPDVFVNSLYHYAPHEEAYERGFRALHMAAKNDNERLVSLLLQYGANIDSWSGHWEHGRTAVGVALHYRSYKSLKVLCSHNVNLNQICERITSQNGYIGQRKEHTGYSKAFLLEDPRIISIVLGLE